MEAVSLRFYDGADGYFLEQYEVISMRQKRKLLKAVSLTVVSAIAALALLTGCGGDAGGSPTPPASSGNPASSAPSSSSSSSSSSSESSSSSSSAKPQGEVVWTFEDNAIGATLTGYDKTQGKPSGYVEIPTKDTTGKPVTKIGKSVFNFTPITGVKIPASVTSIEQYAFAGCNLKQLDWPQNVPVLDDYVLSMAVELESINLPEGVTKIGKYAFRSCEKLTTISLPESVTSIDEGAFSGCSGLKEIYIPGSVTYLDYTVFSSLNIETIYYGGNRENLTIKNEDGTTWATKIQTVTENPLIKNTK